MRTWFFVGLLLLASWYPDQTKAVAAIIWGAPTWAWGLAALPVAFAVMLACEVRRRANVNVAGIIAEALGNLESESGPGVEPMREMLRKELVKDLWFAAISKWVGNIVLVAGALVAVWPILQALPTTH